MTAKDGIPFSVFSTSTDLRRALKSDGFTDLPKSAHTIKKIVIGYSQKIKSTENEHVLDLKRIGRKFSVTFDEWSSIKNRRYMNVILHGKPQEFWNLGLIRIHGSLPAEKCLEMVANKLRLLNLSLENDIVCIITDGSSVMTKIGRLSPTYQQLCFAHGIQLGVLDVLYKKINQTPEADESENENLDNLAPCEDDSCCDSDSDSEEIDEDEDEDLVISHTLRPVIDKVRTIVRMFRRSPLKNEILQTYIKQEFGKELSLILDCKTRWNSLVAMLERFYTVQASIKKALVDVRSDAHLKDWELARISDIVDALKPIEATIEALCRRDANLLTADTALNFMIQKLDMQQSGLALELGVALRTRIEERRTELSGLFKYLHTGQYINSEQDEIFSIPKPTKICSLIRNIICRLRGMNDDASELQEGETNIIEKPGPSQVKKFKSDLTTELNKAISAALSSSPLHKVQPEKSLTTTIKKEMKLFEDGGKRGFHLELAYEFLIGIVPTSVESERAFSSSGYLCNKLRSSMRDDTLDHLCFLRSHFQKID
ncbi:uncharacterized protein LOC118439484 [Folsomia candida]|uniref:uncharacterized protein LOC118439484 n=1 Tax=Folsomia candida TaxID=158441 RepID=UPI0016052B12|nr:uncharacterized protein LOC118439484 [Folsomia candida]